MSSAAELIAHLSKRFLGETRGALAGLHATLCAQADRTGVKIKLAKRCLHKAYELAAFELIMQRRSIAGSLVGGLAETQKMLDFCAQRGIVADVETTPPRLRADAEERRALPLQHRPRQPALIQGTSMNP